ncbi:MAG: hypothetical protein ACQGQP_03340, partial [Desulfovibrio sp.]
VQSCGMDKVGAGAILSAGAAAGIAGVPLAAVVSDAIRSRKAVIIAMTAVQALCIAVLAAFPGRLPVPALMALAAAFAFCDGAAGLCSPPARSSSPSPSWARQQAA